MQGLLQVSGAEPRKELVAIIDTRTEAEGVLRRKFTVSHMQVYTVELHLTTKTFRSDHRYSEFRQLHSQLQSSGLFTPSAALPPFPKPVIMSLKPTVVAHRKEVIDTYLKAWAKQEKARGYLLRFLGVPHEESSAERAEDCKSEGEAAISNLQIRLSQESRNKLQILTDFSLSPFHFHQKLRPAYIQAFWTELLPLCGDAVCGPQALALVNMMLDKGRVGNAYDLKQSLLRMPVPVLCAMALDKHLLGDFTGDSHSEAFALCSLLQEALPISVFMAVLNKNAVAIDRFRGWRDGTLLVVCGADRSVRKASGDWVESDSSLFPGLCIRHKSELSGLLQLSVTMAVQASPLRVAECLLDLDTRRQWDKWMRHGSVVNRLSDDCSLIAFTFDYDFLTVSLVTYVEKRVEQGKLIIEYRRITDTADTDYRSSPLISVYVLSAGTDTCDLLSRGEGMSEDETVPVTARLKAEETANRCVLKYSAMHTQEMRKFLTPDLLGERDVMSEVWWRLKQTAENNPLPSYTRSLLMSSACDLKSLAKVPHSKSET